MNFKISNKKIGEDAPVFIVAELSANHLQDFELAVKTIKAMKDAGADAVKFQTYTADTLTIDCDNEKFIINSGTLWDGKTFYELYKSAYLPWEWHEDLIKLVKDLGLIWFSTPTDFSSVDFLFKLNVPAYKVTSFEITDVPLIEYIAKKKKPIIFSLGIAELEDIKNVVDICKKQGNNDIAFLKCTSSYPADPKDMNLKTIPDLEKKFNVVPGLSDHTLSLAVPVAAVSLGAKIIEKHFILDRGMGGPDAAFSLEPNEFKDMVKTVREAEQSLGKVTYELTEQAKISRQFSKSIFVVQDIKEGDVFTQENIRVIRPGIGMHPKYYKDVLGKKAKKAMKRGEPLNL